MTTGASAPTSRTRRCIDVVLTVAVWMALGWALEADGNQYLLLGVPVTAAFQLGIRRRPTRELWVRDAPPVRHGRVGWAIALALMIVPAAGLIRLLIAPDGRGDWTRIAWHLCAVAGALGAAYALAHFRRPQWQAFFRCLVIAGGIGVALMVAARFARQAELSGSLAVADLFLWFLLYLPVAFVLEEVTFRGALDAHVHHPGESGYWSSAIFIAALWGLWHLPVVAARDQLSVTAVGLVVAHIAIGVPLAHYWRQSGNLAVPAATHAAIDAVRNTLLG